MKTWKIASITSPAEQVTYTVIRDNTAQEKPFTVYQEWYCEGKHRTKLAKYDDLASALCLIYGSVYRRNTF